MQKVEKKRIWYWDILRIAAVVCLVIRHIATASFDFVPALGAKWWIFNIYGSLVAWMVPVYLMLSGASFLDPNKQISIKTLYTRNIFHMAITFFAWSAIYVGYNLLSGQDALRPVHEMFFEGHFHLWFLPMIIGIYMLLPAFRIMSQSMRGTAYMFLLSLGLGVTLPMVFALFAVAALSAQNATVELWADFRVGMEQWTQASHISALTQWALPAFAMLTGSLFLAPSRPYNTQTIWKNVIPSIAFSCVFWWGLAAVVCLQKHYPQEIDTATYVHCLGLALDMPFNIGYCQMLVSMFLLYPLLWRITTNTRTAGYCLIVLFLINSVLPMLKYVPYVSTVTLFTDQLNWGFFRIWAFYLMLGAYLSYARPSWSIRLSIYCMGIVSTGLMVALTSWGTKDAVGFCSTYLGMSSPFTVCQAAAAFLAVSTLCDAGMPGALGRMKGLWMSAPIVGVVSFFSARFIPADSGNFARYVAGHVFADTFLTIMLTMGLGAIPGFRVLVGYFHLEGMQK